NNNNHNNNNHLELLLMLLLGLSFGIGLSQLLQRARRSSSSSSEVSQSWPHSNSLTYTPAAPSHKQSNNSRILCLIVPGSLHSQAVHIERTWGRRCSKLLFATTETQAVVGAAAAGAAALPAKQRHSSSWAKTRARLQHVHKQYYRQFDWFLSVPDSTYVIVENLQHFLSDHAPETPIYFGSDIWQQVSHCSE
ncbi:hypothetical protein KR222_005962, partial [Zaprionus bogoriensis]